MAVLRSYLSFVVLLAAVWLAGGAGPAWADPDPAGRIIHFRGRTLVADSRESDWTKPQPNRLLPVGAAIRTGPDGWAALLLADETLIQIGRNSLFILNQVAPTAAWRTKVVQVKATGPEAGFGSVYRLEAGRLWLRNKNPGTRILLHTPTVSAGTRGTELNLIAEPDQTVSLTLLEGSVGVWNKQGSVELVPGEQVTTRPGSPPQKKILLHPRRAVQWTIALPPLYEKDLIRPEIDRAHRLLLTHRFDEAGAILEKLGRDSPSAAGLGLLALVRLTAGQRTEAGRLVDQALKLNRTDPTVWLVKAYILQAGYDLEAALEATEEAVRLKPDYQPALLRRAELLFGKGYTDRSKKIVARVIAQAPDNGWAVNLQGFLHLAQRRTGPALDAFNRAAGMIPDSGEPHLGRALALMRRGEVEAAFQALTTAVLLEPQRALFVCYWGKLLYQIDRFQPALDALVQAAKLDPNDPSPHLYRAIVLRDLNRPTEAVAAMNRAVGLNDNRAVYRSRLLLDQDLAVKNVALSILYDQLGLSAWAFNKAMASVKHDYLNSSAHKFLAGALLGLEGRLQAAQNETILAQIFEPANLNSFNTFNQYTSFFEEPWLKTTLTGQFTGRPGDKPGDKSGYHGQIEADGGLPSANLAFRVAGSYEDIDGWRKPNDNEAGNLNARLKWDPAAEHGLLLGGLYRRSQYVGRGMSDWEYDRTPPDARDWYKATMAQAYAGYHWRISPRTNLLFFFNTFDYSADYTQHYSLGPFDLEGAPAWLRVVDNIDSKIPYYHAQGQFHTRLGDHQLMIGTVHTWGGQQVTLDEYADLDFGGGLILPYGEIHTDYNPDKGFHSAYIQDTWRIHPKLTLEAALYYDYLRQGNAFSGAEWEVGALDPRLGLIYTPTERDTFRLAGFRYLHPMYLMRVDPTDIAGVTIHRNQMEGSISTEADLVYEREWSSGFWSANLFYVERELPFKYITDEGSDWEKERGRTYGGETVLNQILGPGLGLSLGYRFMNVTEETDPRVDRAEHQAVASLSYVHPIGASARVSQTFRFLDPDDRTVEDESIWLTDAKIGFELPHKRGRINLEVLNIFDNRFNWLTDFFVLTGRNPCREFFVTVELVF